MKILLVNNLYPPNAVGGYERLCAAVATGLAARGHDVAVLTSDWGTVPASGDDVPVERTLKLPVAKGNIYAPFEGTPAEKAALDRSNVQRLEAKLAALQPEVVLAGNLYFFDCTLEAALSRRARSLVYLLTDVWMINVFNPGGVGSYLRDEVLAAAGPGAPLAPADPPALFVEPIESRAAWEARAERQVFEELRRRDVEDGLARERSSFQLPGVCCLCGPTLFLARRPGPETLVLSARAEEEVICARCGLDAATRALLEISSRVAPGVGAGPRLIICARPGTRMLLERLLPDARVAESAEAVRGPQRFSQVLLADLPEAAKDTSAFGAAARRLAPGGAVLFTPPLSLPREGWAIAAAAEASGLTVDAHALWSTSHGFLGRERLAFAARAPAAQPERVAASA